MKKRRKRWLGLCIVLGVLFSSNAAKTQAEPISTYTVYTTTASASLSISNITANISGDVTGIAGVTKTNVKLYFQRKVSGNWLTIDTYEMTSMSRRCQINESRVITKGYTYRVKGVFTTYKNGDSETTTHYSSTVSA